MVFKEASGSNHQPSDLSQTWKYVNILVQNLFFSLKKNQNIKASKFGHSPISLFNSSPSKGNKIGHHHPILFKQLGTKRWEINMIELVSLYFTIKTRQSILEIIKFNTN